MNISARIAELKRHIEEIKSAYRDHAANDPLPELVTRAKYARNLGKGLAVAVSGWCRELAALEAPIVSLAVHDGKLLLATSGGVFEIKDGKLIWVELSTEEGC